MEFLPDRAPTMDTVGVEGRFAVVRAVRIRLGSGLPHAIGRPARPRLHLGRNHGDIVGLASSVLDPVCFGLGLEGGGPRDLLRVEQRLRLEDLRHLARAAPSRHLFGLLHDCGDVCRIKVVEEPIGAQHDPVSRAHPDGGDDAVLGLVAVPAPGPRLGDRGQLVRRVERPGLLWTLEHALPVPHDDEATVPQVGHRQVPVVRNGGQAGGAAAFLGVPSLHDSVVGLAHQGRGVSDVLLLHDGLAVLHQSVGEDGGVHPFAAPASHAVRHPQHMAGGHEAVLPTVEVAILGASPVLWRGLAFLVRVPAACGVGIQQDLACTLRQRAGRAGGR
mmetsp:Transcript_32467/g.58238  ORF Transcript_32467/g.58238 Transcript_32467/m.58238 type:complete len:331 (-) Transcript_32467:159-1151(-)